jgi:7-cyano-7-deazaguanine tRNA-ribosyltransferase
MTFQVHRKDLLGRVGTITTKSGAFTTPHMFPVLDPNGPRINKRLFEESDIQAVMTNAYLLGRSRDWKDPVDVHTTLGFDKTVATDSGAYQILQYGKVGVQPREIVEYQEKINTDIGVILDVPTGFKPGLGHAHWTVDETIRRADEALKNVTRKDILWVGPVQGGTDLVEVERCALSMSKRDFSIYALGSPTELMEGQHFEVLVDMIITAKQALPFEKPLHLFGAGHPAIFPFLTALGCDLFDSAAYALYARAGRYLTSDGTLLLEDMREYACPCPACRDTTPAETWSLAPAARESRLMQHNLTTCFAELRRVREAIRRGRLWDLLEMRSGAHPAFKKCFARIRKYSDIIQAYNPLVKPHGIFYFGSTTNRPEITTYASRLSQVRPAPKSMWLLLPGRWRRPFHEDPRYQAVAKTFENSNRVRTCFYSVAYGPVPLELDESFPIAQTESYDPRDSRLYTARARDVARFVSSQKPRRIVIVSESAYGHTIYRELSRVFSRKYLSLLEGDKSDEDLINDVKRKLTTGR